MNYGLVLTARARADILRKAEWWAGVDFTVAEVSYYRYS